MNAIGIALVWCIVQVTLLGLLSGALYLIVQRIRPGAGAAVALSGLLAVVTLSALALSPWPRWPLDLTSRSRTDFQSVPENNRTNFQSVPPPVDGLKIRPTPNDHVAASPPASSDDSTLSTAASLWRGFLDEVSQAQPAPEGTAWGWPAVIAVVVLTGMASGLAWLLLGLLSVRSHRARSQLVEDAGLLALVNQLRAELGCRRPVELHESDDLVTAATIGALRPCILLPRDWASWTEEQRRAVLAHELAHVRRNDFLAVLAGQLGVVLHFYHPLLHWLMGRLRLEQELAADAVAAGVSGGQRKYLLTIAELALRQQDRPLAWPARTFLPTRTTFLRRIAMLRDSRLRFDRLSPVLRVVIVAVVAACGVLVAGLRGPSGSAPALADDSTKPAAAADDSIDITFLTESAAAFIVMRPAAFFTRPELIELEKRDHELGFERLGIRLRDLRQITTVLMPTAVPDPPKLPLVIVVQATKPIPVTSLVMYDGQGRATLKLTGDYRGKKIYAASNLDVLLQYDDRTVVIASTEQAIVDYLSSKRGVLPKWLPVKEWETFRGDQWMVAADTMTTRDMESFARRAIPLMIAGGAETFPRLPREDAVWLGVGARFQDLLAVHACVAAKNADAASNVRRTIEALTARARNVVKDPPGELLAFDWWYPVIVVELSATGALLDNLKITKEGTEVRLESSIAWKKAWSDAIVQALTALREPAKNITSALDLKDIVRAMLNYEQKNKRFPPAVFYGPDGKTPYSWRVALLPLLGRDDLYRRYRFDEPWDGPNNRKLLAEIPSVYRSPADSPTSTSAAYFALVGARTVFAPGEMVSMASIRDYNRNTILVVEAKRDIPWTKPEDIPFDPDKPVPPLGGFFPGIFHAAMCNSTVLTFRTDNPEDILRLLIIKDHGKPIPWDKIRWR